MKTVKVRIAVAVDPKGNWNASGWSNESDPPSDEALMESPVVSVDPGEARYFIEAELPIPEVKTVPGTVIVEGKENG